MVNSIKLIQSLDTPIATKRDRTRPTKSRRQRRSEERDRVKATKINQKKIG